MSKVKKAVLLFLIAIIFAIISLFDLTLGTLSFIVNILRSPFRWTAQWLIQKSDYIIIK